MNTLPGLIPESDTRWNARGGQARAGFCEQGIRERS